MRILLCEDEKRLSDALVTIFKHNNLSVDAVYDGLEAIGALASTTYDAVVLDIMMPKMDGLEVLERLRSEGNNVPVIMLTAKAQTDDIVKALDMGANDYLVKPFDSKELIARLRAMTRKSSGELTSILKFGNVSLDQTKYTLSTDKESVLLSNKEFQVIELMMLNPNNLFSTERLMDKVWGFNSNSEINVVWVHISALRKKIASIGGDIAIHASRGIGYSLKQL